VKLNVREFFCRLSQMQIESGVTPFALPPRIDLLRRVAENGAEPMLNANNLPKFG
jgi:hypothetical protein